jgi:hypothetical protein
LLYRWYVAVRSFRAHIRLQSPNSRRSRILKQLRDAGE